MAWSNIGDGGLRTDQPGRQRLLMGVSGAAGGEARPWVVDIIIGPDGAVSCDPPFFVPVVRDGRVTGLSVGFPV